MWNISNLSSAVFVNFNLRMNKLFYFKVITFSIVWSKCFYNKLILKRVLSIFKLYIVHTLFSHLYN